MSQQPSDDLERCLTELQTQIEGLGGEIRQPQPTDLESVEQRLSQLTDQWGAVLDKWAATGERHARIVEELEARLGNWNELEERFQRESAHRFRDLEHTISCEWDSLRRLHEAPVKELREQAAVLTEVSTAAAESAQHGLERAEGRLATLETELHRRMTDLSRSVMAAIADSRSDASRSSFAAAGGASVPSLENVTPALEQPPEASGATEPNGQSAPAEGHEPGLARPIQPVLSEVSALAGRIDSLERALVAGQAEINETLGRTNPAGRWRLAVALLALAVIAVGGLSLWVRQQVDSAGVRVVEAERQARLAGDAAAARATPPREDATGKVTEAREAAVKAQIVSDVLAAPDLVRYVLTPGEGAGRASAQLLWSRSRGLVFSASQLAPAPADSTYQVWLLTRAEPVSAGLVVVDASGRITYATDQPPVVPRPVIGVSVTVEPARGSEQPSGTPVLATTPR